MAKKEQITDTKHRLKKVLERLSMKQPKCQERSDIKSRDYLLKKLKELENN